MSFGQLPTITRKTVGGAGGSAGWYEISLLGGLTNPFVAVAIAANQYVAPRTRLLTVTVRFVPADTVLVYVALAGP